MLINNISSFYHPTYQADSYEWAKWRLTAKANDQFIAAYLQQFRDREDANDFACRRAITYVPAFAKAAINEIKNSIFERTTDIVRVSDSTSYNRAINGLDGGVDLQNSSMSFFIGQKILFELLTMKKVGVFVDMPQLYGNTLLDQVDKRPYIYYYCVEDIINWANRNNDKYSSLILRDHIYTTSDYGLPTEQTTRTRHLWLENGTVYARYYDSIDKPETEPIPLNIPDIPFVLFELNESLLADVSNYQIALMNLASSDMTYALLANYPFYTEQFDTKTESYYLNDTVTDPNTKPKDENVVQVGPTRGRRYPINTERPAFISPSSEPLKISMEKQKQLKEEIYALVQLAVTNISPVRDSSSTAKQIENKGLESGLSYIGLILENGERQIGKFWSAYEKKEAPTIIYPEEYSLISGDEVRKQNEQDLKIADSINSMTLKREICKRIAKRTIGNKVSSMVMAKIYAEIDNSNVPCTIIESLTMDIEKGLVSNKFASEARGYPEDQVEEATKDQAKRLALIQSAQTPHPTTNTLAPVGSGKLEKQKANDTTLDVIPTDKTRGNGRP